jgi:hypothetical protein
VPERERTSTVPPPAPHARRRIGYAATTFGLTALMLTAVIDGTTPAAIFGVDSASITRSGTGFELTVTYGEVSRPALATPFDIEVVRPDGFDEPVRIAVDQEYLRMWDENGLVPAPSGESIVGDWVVWEFEPPSGTSLRVTYDARIEPAAQEGRSGSVALLDDDDVVLARIDFTTRVMP